MSPSRCEKACMDKKTAQTRKNHHERNGRILRIYMCDQEEHDGSWHLTHKLDKKDDDN